MSEINYCDNSRALHMDFTSFTSYRNCRIRNHRNDYLTIWQYHPYTELLVIS